MNCRSIKFLRRVVAAALLLWVLPLQVVSALDFPYVYFFSFTPSFKFALESDRGNTLRFDTNIELTPDYNDSKVLYLKFFMTWVKDGETIKYVLRFMVDPGGNVYLNEIDDGAYNRMFFDQVMFFPRNVAMGSTYQLGDNIKIDFVKKLNSLTVNDKKFYDVIETRITLADKEWTVYFARSNGIIGIKCADETYRWTR